MPFITEELYQRLPRPAEVVEKIPSICVASYPGSQESRWKNDVIEGEVEFVQKVARSIRSARSDYNLPNKTKTEGNHRFTYDIIISLFVIIFFNNNFGQKKYKEL